MSKNALKKLPDGSWQLEYEDASGKIVTQVFKTVSEEEADRLVDAYLKKLADGGQPVKRVARGTGPKGKSSLVD